MLVLPHGLSESVKTVVFCGKEAFNMHSAILFASNQDACDQLRSLLVENLPFRL
jgi:hypothetical protein